MSIHFQHTAENYEFPVSNLHISGRFSSAVRLLIGWSAQIIFGLTLQAT